MELRIHSKTSTVAPANLDKRWPISSHTLSETWIPIHARIKVKPFSERTPSGYGKINLFWITTPSQTILWWLIFALQWRRNEHDGVSNHQPHDCLINRLFGQRSNKTSKFRVTGLCAENSPVTGEFPAKGPATRKMFPFDDVIMDRTLPCNPLENDLAARTRQLEVDDYTCNYIRLVKPAEW